MRRRIRRRGGWAAAFLLLLLSLAVTGAGSAAPAASKNRYVRHNLVSDGFAPADHIDANLVNAWGLDAGPMSPWWVADAENDVSTLYDAVGNPQSLVVSAADGPTGLVFNGTSSFVVSAGVDSGVALFLFATEDGKIRGWSPAVPPPPFSMESEVGADRSSVGASYKGLAIASTPSGNFLYATDFHNGRVDVFDGSFNLINNAGGFADAKIPSGFAPFGIRALGQAIYVTYAKQDADREEDVTGRGLGFVDVFDTSGHLLHRVATRGRLNAPWGLAIAPTGFGRFSGDLLVGNFGNGQINAYTPKPNGTFTHHGTLRRANHKPITIGGLWALSFGKGSAANGPTDTLFFTAGPNDEEHGLFGTIKAG
jgi:uncharacterized protein (TIGR03118 family)